MAEHPIQGLMGVTIEKIRDMVNAETIIGDPIHVDDTTIIPVSRVTFGFASGGSDVGPSSNKQMFGGGSGAGVSVTPVAFLVVSNGNVRTVQLVEKVSAIPLAQGKGIQRYFFSGAAEVEPDKQGRILIPQSLREHAGLEKDVTVIGAAVRAEIWDTARWNAYNESQTDEAIEASMNLLDF